MYHTLISGADLARELAAAGERFRVLDCRARLGDPAFGAAEYARGHIPGAVHVSLDHDLAGTAGARGRHPLPDPERLAARFRAWGVDDDQQIVVYDDAGGAFAARAWWCARWLGHAAVAVLDGGLQEWTGPLDTDRPGPAPGSFSVRPALTRTIDADTLQTRLDVLALVDARSQPRFEGVEEPIDPVAGHIPGAVCLPFQQNLAADGRFLDRTVLAERFRGLPEDVVCYCGSGVTAAHNVLAMRVAGRPEPILYPGSWSEWIQDPARPRTPS